MENFIQSMAESGSSLEEIITQILIHHMNSTQDDLSDKLKEIKFHEGGRMEFRNYGSPHCYAMIIGNSNDLFLSYHNLLNDIEETRKSIINQNSKS